jgi:hypothetical protein
MLNEGISFLPESYIKHSIEQGELVMLNIEDMPNLQTTPLLIKLCLVQWPFMVSPFNLCAARMIGA